MRRETDDDEDVRTELRSAADSDVDGLERGRDRSSSIGEPGGVDPDDFSAPPGFEPNLEPGPELVAVAVDGAPGVRAPGVRDPADLAGLLGRIAGGDREAFSRLYDAVAPRLFGLVRRLVVDPAQSEEVTQEVFLEIWQTAARFTPDRGSAHAWLFTLAHRRAVDRIRAAQASRMRDHRVGVRDVPVDVDTVSEEAELRIEHERVSVALRDLTGVQREAIELAYYRGLSQSEIATELSVPIGTVKTRIRDGMIRLREALGVTA